ncbi:MAG: hypothetical protein GXP55_09225 [Deltaproteobacteria bacterium]|nr:hypothetical protein [Deltaproteobacteria bacterium]
MTAHAKLDPDKILQTSERLEARICERFPESGLARVCERLVQLADHARETSEQIRRPQIPIRVASVLIIGLMLAAIVAAAWAALTQSTGGRLSWSDLVQVAEAAVNDLVLVGVAIYFLASFERRIKRARVVRALHDLRRMAHLIDVHQLTKTPYRAEDLRPESEAEAVQTSSSPKRHLSRFQMGRYLDYCSEMLSLTGKISALYGDGFGDAVALEAVNGVEALTIGLQRKIWQKMMLLSSGSAGGK